MKIKENQFVRTKGGVIGIYKGDCSCAIDHAIIDIGNYDDYYNQDIEEEKIIAIANTLQELLQVGDLVSDGKFCMIIENFRDDEIGRLVVSKTYHKMYLGQITKIWTPNKKGDYILQWEA